MRSRLFPAVSACVLSCCFALASSSSARAGLVYHNLDASIGGITVLVQDTTNPSNNVSRPVGDIVTLAGGGGSQPLLLEDFQVGLEYQGSAITNGTLTLRIFEYENNAVVNGNNPFVKTTNFTRPFSPSFTPFLASFDLKGLDIQISTPELAWLIESSPLTLGAPTAVTNTLKATTNNNNPGPGFSDPNTFAIGVSLNGFQPLDLNFGGNVVSQINAIELAETPEPSSLVLTAMAGLLALGGAVRRTRRGKVQKAD